MESETETAKECGKPCDGPACIYVACGMVCRNPAGHDGGHYFRAPEPADET